MVGFTTGFGTATPPTSTAVVSPRAEASPNQPQPVSILYPCRSSAQGTLPQVPQGHPGVAKRASISTLARGPSTEALLGQGRVAKGRKSVPLPGLRSSLRPGLARHHRLSLTASPERPSMTRGSDSSKVEPRKTTSGDLISIIRRSNAQSQLKASTIS